MRLVTLCFTVLVTIYAINSDASIFHMVENAYQVTLVAAFTPLAFGVFWSRATNQGALFAITAGVCMWLALLFSGSMTAEDMAVLPNGLDVVIRGIQPLQVLTPQGAGLIASILGMVIGSLVPQVFTHDPQSHHRLRTAHLRPAEPDTATAIAD
jgi:Na+(H+)/acetate symporter ActP